MNIYTRGLKTLISLSDGLNTFPWLLAILLYKVWFTTLILLFRYRLRKVQSFAYWPCQKNSYVFLAVTPSGITRTSPSQLSYTDSYPSSIHDTPDRKKFSKDEWVKFTRDTTKRAVEELVSSPDFSKWAAANAERITVTPSNSSANASARRRWFLWS